jgi:serine/threonine protein kinase
MIYTKVVEDGPAIWGMYIDTFSLGVCLFRVLVGRFPFAVANKDDPLYQLLQTDVKTYLYEEILQYLHDENDLVLIDFLKLVCKCLSKDAEERPMVAELMEHAFISSQKKIFTVPNTE